ncbi:hypothetical protein [Corynebacterium suicordis]|uniref:PPE family domain-containing protein n=1 Tax=Corynebacterium suicordis DSM 45110 TaxID=1121369 RepID=A0ABR9ZJS4_9CORY|nr:hypothetical protein [Corynebacterium suicordis]MBF4553696.1 hypothetical protein [Corynebacterium suicordis DSM 45110]MDR6277328.1 hypothetical protein [Corynebacterium suicordis]
MIKFDLAGINSVKNHLELAELAVSTVAKLSNRSAKFTNSPSLSASFAQHQTYFSGQPGAMTNVIRSLKSDIKWLQEMFDSHITAFELQDQLSSGSFDQMNSTIEFDQKMVRMRNPERDFKPISNLIYTQPVTAVEATTPLLALIAMFEGNDGAPIQSAQNWMNAGKKLVESMTALQAASSAMAASAEGYSFDMARTAIGDVVKTGNVVGANAVIMGQSMMEFPAVRLANLNALRAIQASTAAIPDQAARIAAEQSAVATFASTQLQPSLELLRPPVANLGTPVVGHMGGGALDSATTSQSSGISSVHTPQGGNATVSTASANGLGGQAQAAANAAPQPSGTVAPASAANAAPQFAQPAASPVSPQPLNSNRAGTTGHAGAMNNSAVVRPSGMVGHGATNTGMSGLTQAHSAQSVRGGVANANYGATMMQRGGLNGPVVPQLPGGRLGNTSSTPMNGRMNALSTPPHGTDSVGGNQSKNALSAGKSGQTTAGGSNNRGGMLGMGGMGANNGKAAAKGAGSVTSRNLKAAAGIFGKRKWAPEVNEYFKRQFMGQKKRTVNKVIR